MINAVEKISALIITYNEIGYIEKCIESVSFADEIVVVDSYSTDGTYEYLLNHPKVKVIQNSFENFTTQKSFTLKQASNEWVLFIDADEIVSENLRDEIIKTVESQPKEVAFWFTRQFMFKNKKLRFSGWQTDKNYRLFKKSKVKFCSSRIVHETLNIEGKTSILKEKLIHFCYKDYTDYKSKMLKYGKMRALEEYKKGNQFSYLKLFLKPFYTFFFNFFFRLGFIDLKKGIVVCYLNALSVYERYNELRTLEREELQPVFSNLIGAH